MTEQNWGSLPSIEGNMQITRSMLDLRRPKSFYLEEPRKIEVKESVKNFDLESLSDFSKNNVRLIEYISSLECLMSDFTSSVSANCPNYPPFEVSIKRRKTQNDMANCNLSNGADFNDIKKKLKHGIALISACSGFSMASSMALQTLNDATHHYMEDFCKSLKSTMDNEALTGKTGFYDSVDQALHDMGIGNIHELSNFYQKSVIQFNKTLVNKSEKLKLQVLQNKTSHSQTVVKQEKLSNNWISITDSSNTSDVKTDSQRAKPFISNETSIQLYNQDVKRKSLTYDNCNLLNDHVWPIAKHFSS